jgi:paraquat-inducible protein A
MRDPKERMIVQQALVVCDHCDTVYRWRPLASAEVARCSRCAAVLGRGHRLNAEGLLALTVTAFVVLLIASLTPIVVIRVGGALTDATLPQAITATWALGERLVAIATALTALVGPALLISLRLALLVPMVRGRTPRGLGWTMRVLHQAGQWSMVEVMMVAAAVCIVRIAAMAHAVPGTGMWAFGVLALIMAGLESGGVKHLWAKAG